MYDEKYCAVDWKQRKLEELRRREQTPEEMERRLPNMLIPLAAAARWAIDEYRREQGL